LEATKILSLGSLSSSSNSSSASENSKVQRKPGSKNVSVRHLSEEFLEVPYQIISNYDELVERPLSLEILRSNLQQHIYKSMASFSKDFYEMLNNGRKISGMADQMVRDTLALQKLFEKAKRETAEVTADQPLRTIDQNAIVSYSEAVVGNMRRTIKSNTFLCSCCDLKVNYYI